MVATLRDGAFDAMKIRLSAGSATDLAQLAREWLVSIEIRTVVPYESTAELADSQVFLIEDEETINELAGLYELGAEAADLPVLGAPDIGPKLSLYGVVAGHADRIVFLKSSDPRIGYSAGRPLLAILGERLTRLHEPAFAFYTSFDLILAPAWVLIANQTAFERLFRDAGLVEQHIDQWVEGIDEQLPWADGSIEALRAVARSDSRVWRRLREIHRRGHLASVSIDQVRNYAVSMNLPIDTLIVNDQLVFVRDERFSILHLLNEDLFLGPLTDERFEAQRKTGA